MNKNLKLDLIDLYAEIGEETSPLVLADNESNRSKILFANDRFFNRFEEPLFVMTLMTHEEIICHFMTNRDAERNEAHYHWLAGYFCHS